jgi:hypothetical protein
MEVSDKPITNQDGGKAQACFRTVLSHHLTSIQLSDISHLTTVSQFKALIQSSLADQIPLLDKVPAQFLRLSSAKKTLFDPTLPLRSYCDDDQVLHLDLYIMPQAYYDVKRELYELESIEEIIEMMMKL